jgi:hypothetical protein
MDFADGNGLLSRMRLLSSNLPSTVVADQLCPLPIVNATKAGLAIVCIDSAQVAVVSPASRDDQSQ